jgi:hypothetical protein
MNPCHNHTVAVSSLLQIDQIVHHIGGDGQIDHPVHQVEAEEGDGEHDPAVLVDVGCLHAEEPLWRGGWRSGGDHWRRHWWRWHT